jgi:hypothetical protein
MNCLTPYKAIITLLLVYTTAPFFSACRNGGTKEQNRKQIISEINRFKQFVLKKDRKGVASFFDFPVKSDGIWYNTSAFDNMNNKGSLPGGMTKEIFLKETDRIILNSLSSFFLNLTPETLESNDTVSKQLILKSEPCMNQYSIILEDDSTVVYELKMGINKQYRLTKADIDDDMDLSSLCEHITWWRFKLRNGRLRFDSLDGAD